MSNARRWDSCRQLRAFLKIFFILLNNYRNDRPHILRSMMPLRPQRRLKNLPTETFGETRAETNRLVSLSGCNRVSQLRECRVLAGLLGMGGRTIKQVITIIYEWRWGKSPANPSPPNSLFNRELTGNFFDFGPRIRSIFGGIPSNSMASKNFTQKRNRE